MIQGRADRMHVLAVRLDRKIVHRLVARLRQPPADPLAGVGIGAVEQGAKLLCGGSRDGRLIEPAVLEKVPHDSEAACEEIFGPVTMLYPYADFDEALAAVNDSRYGLQAGVFTRDIGRIQTAWDELAVGGVMINEVPSFRVDHMPYGGTKDSGLGREGLRWAIESMTEPRLLVIRNPR